jgi:hypothetical protein
LIKSACVSGRSTFSFRSAALVSRGSQPLPCCVASGATLQIKCVHAFTCKTKRSSSHAQSDF